MGIFNQTNVLSQPEIFKLFQYHWTHKCRK